MLSRGVAAVAAGALVAVASPVATAAESVTLTGTYRRMAKEVVVGATATHAYDDLLVTPSRTYRLRLRGTKPRPNATVTLSARSEGGDYAVASYRTLSAAPAAPAAALGATRTLAILAYWTAPDAMTKEKAVAQLFTDGSNYMRENSYGASTLSGSVTPWVRIAAPTEGRCYDFADQILDRARAAAASIGYAWGSFDRTLVYFPRCTASDTTNLTGWAYEPGDSIWMNGVMDRRTAVHEHGHSFGMGHARALTCTSGGVRVTLSETCSAHEYGDPFDAMGQSGYAAHFSGPHKDEVGWLGSRKRIMTTTSGTYTLAPFERSSANPLVLVANSAQVTGRRYWLEYRQPVGFDARLPVGATAGVLVRVQDTRFGPGPYLLDATPGDGTFGTAVLGAGRTWTSPDGVRVYVGSVTSTGATVTVTGAKAVPVPPSAPRSLAGQAGDSRARLTWLPPSSLGNGTLTRYAISWSNGSQYANPDELEALLTWLWNDTPTTFSVRAVNEAGPGPAATVTVTPRSSPPTVRITSPTEGQLAGDTVVATADAAPGPNSLTPLVAVNWRVNGTSHGNRDPGTPFLFSTIHLPNGSNTLEAVAQDENGNAASSAVTFRVGNYKPSVSLTAPVSGTTFHGRGVVMTATPARAEDGVAIDRVEFVDTQYGKSYGVDREAPYEMTWDTTWVTSYYHTVTARVVDVNGRSADSALRWFYVTHPSPTVTSVTPAAGSTVRGTSLTVAAAVATGTQGVPVDRVEFSAMGTWSVDRTAPYEATFDTSARRGYEGVTVRVYETSGRSGGTSFSYWLDNPLPLVRVTSPAYNASLRTRSLTLTGTAVPASGGAAVERVVVEAAGRTQSAAVAPDGTWSVAADVSGLYGWQTASVTAYDAAGYSATAPTQVYLTRPVPTLAVVAPTAGSALAEGPNDLVASVSFPDDTVTTISRVCFRYSRYYELGCAAPRGDGTWLAAGARLSPGRYPISVQVYESDGHSNQSAGVEVTVSGKPFDLYNAYATTYDDATVYVGWGGGYYDDVRPIDEIVVREDTGAVVARVQRGVVGVVVKPSRIGVRQTFTVEAVNAYGASTPTRTASVTPRWRGDVSVVAVWPTSATYPGTVAVRARAIRSDGVPIAGATMEVAIMPAAGGAASRFWMPPAAADGWSSVTFTPPFTGDVVVDLAEQPTYYGGAVVGGRVTVAARVEGNLTSARIPLGRATGFNGGVRPAMPGRRVAMQRYLDGAWRTVLWAEQDYLGRVSFPFKPVARGTYTYRLAYGGDVYRSGGVSPARVLTVY